jgi:ubiquinone/menaquinone biosynthesis C-methylase UbiE
MNHLHRILCRSGLWRRTLQRDVLPWVLDGVELGDDVLEIGPGPGLTTDLLKARVKRLTAIEIDRPLATALGRRLEGTNVAVLNQDATEIQITDASFDSAVCLMMLHHVASLELQDKLLHEVARVLRPGGYFIGCDLTFLSRFDPIHLFDTKVPVPPETFPMRLNAAGFQDINIHIRSRAFRFQARTNET